MEKMNLFKFYNRIKNMNILLQFKGALSQEILIEMGELVSQQERQFRREIQKSFSVFVELAQNIMNYSAEREIIHNNEVGVGIIVFTDDHGYYNIYSGNIMSNQDKEALIDKIETINKADYRQLKQMYKEQGKNPRIAGKSAGMGLIVIARQCTGGIGYKISKINKKTSFLEINVKIKKEEKNEKFND